LSQMPMASYDVSNVLTVSARLIVISAFSDR
jgi:hypothetical protein